MENKRINVVFGGEFLNSNFWLYWHTMFAFEEWHSALEMKLYLHRFIHQITLLAIERGVPEVFNSTYDVRMLLSAIGRLRDGREIDIPGPAFLRNLLMNQIERSPLPVSV